MNRLAFSIPTQNDAEQRQLFENFRACGFQSLQLKGGQYLRYLDEPTRFLDDWGEWEGANAALIYGGALDESGVANLRRVWEFAAQIGAKILVFCHAKSRASVSDAEIRAFAQQLSHLGEESAARGVKLSLHHHFDNPVMHRADFERFFAEISPQNLGLTLDTAHLIKSDVWDIAGVIRDFAPFLDNVHFKDFAKGEFQTLGRGEIDFEVIFQTLQTIGFEGWMCADEESATAIEESLHASADFLRRGIEKPNDFQK